MAKTLFQATTYCTVKHLALFSSIVHTDKQLQYILDASQLPHCTTIYPLDTEGNDPESNCNAGMLYFIQSKLTYP